MLQCVTPAMVAHDRRQADEGQRVAAMSETMSARASRVRVTEETSSARAGDV